MSETAETGKGIADWMLRKERVGGAFGSARYLLYSGCSQVSLRVIWNGSPDAMVKLNGNVKFSVSLSRTRTVPFW
jgi:hypothetical protein